MAKFTGALRLLLRDSLPRSGHDWIVHRKGDIAVVLSQAIDENERQPVDSCRQVFLQLAIKGNVKLAMRKRRVF